MKQKDIDTVELILTEHPFPSTGRGLLLCPSSQEIAAVMKLLPRWSFDILEQKDWDLMNPYSGDVRYDIALMCNMFMYSSDPMRWLKNLAGAVDLLVVQDVIRCPRMPDAELGSDGDSYRYSFPSQDELPRIDGFDLEAALGDGILRVAFYSDDGNGDRDCRKFVGVFDLRRV